MQNVKAVAVCVVWALVFGLEAAERPWMDASLKPDVRAKLLVKEMTLEEKVGEMILVGAYPKVLEHNKMLGAMLAPVPIASTCSWDEEAIRLPCGSWRSGL